MKIHVVLSIALLMECRRISEEENKLLKELCGRHIYLTEAENKSRGSARRIQASEYPWLARLEHDDGWERFNCLGALISSGHVLTAAHCLTETDKQHNQEQCYLKKSSRRFKRSLLNVTNFAIYLDNGCGSSEGCKGKYLGSKIWFNDDWDPCDQTDDIAIIELAEDARTRRRTPICLPDAVAPLDKHLRAFGSGGKGALSNKPLEGTLSEAKLHLFAERASLKTFQTLSKFISTTSQTYGIISRGSANTQAYAPSLELFDEVESQERIRATI